MAIEQFQASRNLYQEPTNSTYLNLMPAWTLLWCWSLWRPTSSWRRLPAHSPALFSAWFAASHLISGRKTLARWLARTLSMPIAFWMLRTHVAVCASCIEETNASVHVRIGSRYPHREKICLKFKISQQGKIFLGQDIPTWKNIFL